MKFIEYLIPNPGAGQISIAMPNPGAGQISIAKQMKFIEYFGDDINFDMTKFLKPLQLKLDEIVQQLKEIDDKVSTPEFWKGSPNVNFSFLECFPKVITVPGYGFN
jgi:hypothetical protein